MSQKQGLRVDVEELNSIFVANNATTSSFWKRLGGNDLPKVIGIVVSISSDLLSYRRKRLAGANESSIFTYPEC